MFSTRYFWIFCCKWLCKAFKYWIIDQFFLSIIFWHHYKGYILFFAYLENANVYIIKFIELKKKPFFAESGSLFIWGKNSHLIRPDKPSNAKFWLPFHINKGLGPIQKVFCGSWHAVALTGNPGRIWLLLHVSCRKSDKLLI